MTRLCSSDAFNCLSNREPAPIKDTLLFAFSHSCSRRPAALWKSLRGRPSCTTGTTWTCRTSWITSKRRCFRKSALPSRLFPSPLGFLRTQNQNLTGRSQKMCLFPSFIFGLGEDFPHERLHENTHFLQLCGLLM